MSNASCLPSSPTPASSASSDVTGDIQLAVRIRDDVRARAACFGEKGWSRDRQKFLNVAQHLSAKLPDGLNWYVRQEWEECARDARRLLSEIQAGGTPDRLRHTLPITDIPTWGAAECPPPEDMVFRQGWSVERVTHDDLAPKAPFSPELNEKISLYQGDICKLRVDACVNAANSTLLGGGGIDGAIHRAAGPLLRFECQTLGGCNTGDAKVSWGYNMPATQIIHTVGPMDKDETMLDSCYKSVFKRAEEHEMRSLAVCCIAVGIYSFPLVKATHIALQNTRRWLEKNHKQVDRVIFVVFRDVENWIYQHLLHAYFPKKPVDIERVPAPDEAPVASAEKDAKPSTECIPRESGEADEEAPPS